MPGFEPFDFSWQIQIHFQKVHNLFAISVSIEIWAPSEHHWVFHKFLSTEGNQAETETQLGKQALPWHSKFSPEFDVGHVNLGDPLLNPVVILHGYRREITKKNYALEFARGQILLCLWWTYSALWWNFPVYLFLNESQKTLHCRNKGTFFSLTALVFCIWHY